MRFSEYIAPDPGRITSQQLEMVNAAFGSKVPEVWIEIAELNFGALRACVLFKTLTDQALATMAVDLVYQLVSSMGGNGIYLPNGHAVVKGETNALIYKEFRGNNYQALASKYHLTPFRIRQIVKEQDELKKSKSEARK